MIQNDDIGGAENAQNFYCDKCHVKCSKFSDWSRHLNTLKHKNDDKMMTNDDNGDATPKMFFCECGKQYSYRQGLNVHRKKCEYYKKSVIDNNDLLEYLMKENSELKNMVIDVCKQIQPINNNQITNTNNNNNNNNTNINSHNKTFNLNVFLNEQCKDAMNITDFVESLQIQLSDLENVGKLGFVEGISNIIIKNLKAMDIHKRPVHCSDSKREVMYVKDEDKWEKENEDKQKIRRAIKRVAYKNTKMLRAFKEKYPDCGKSSSKYADQYNKLVIETMGGRGDNDLEKENKIIKNIAKQTIIEK
jgi:hypothetical protein